MKKFNYERIHRPYYFAVYVDNRRGVSTAVCLKDAGSSEEMDRHRKALSVGLTIKIKRSSGRSHNVISDQLIYLKK